MTRDIYRKAQQVLSWLGEERNDTRQAWAFFDVLEIGFNGRFERLERDLNDTSKEDDSREIILPPQANTPSWDSVRTVRMLEMSSASCLGVKSLMCWEHSVVRQLNKLMPI